MIKLRLRIKKIVFAFLLFVLLDLGYMLFLHYKLSHLAVEILKYDWSNFENYNQSYGRPINGIQNIGVNTIENLAIDENCDASDVGVDVGLGEYDRSLTLKQLLSHQYFVKYHCDNSVMILRCRYDLRHNEFRILGYTGSLKKNN